jgi:hypothetical protein
MPARPIRRSLFVAAKILVSFLRYVCIVAALHGEAILLGFLAGLTCWDRYSSLEVLCFAGFSTA